MRSRIPSDVRLHAVSVPFCALAVMAWSCGNEAPAGGPAGGASAVTSRVSALSTTACTTSVKLQDSSSPLIRNPKIYFLFWGDYWHSLNGGLEFARDRSDWATMANTPVFYRQLSEYGIGDGRYLGESVQLPNLGTTNPVPETTITAQLAAEIGQNGVPASDANTLYVIMLPKNTLAAYDGGGPGHHQSTVVGGKNVWYAVIAYAESTDDFYWVISHEIYEAVTDPIIGRGYCDATKAKGCGSNEIGDLCPAQSQTLRGMLIQAPFSEKLCNERASDASGCTGAPTTVLETMALTVNNGNNPTSPHSFHTLRLPNGAWDPFVPIGPSPVPTALEMQNIGGTTTQVMAVSSKTLYHALRNQDGSWTTFSNASAAMGTSQNILSMGMAQINVGNGFEMHLCAASDARVLFHGVRYADGSWSTLNDTRGVLGNHAIQAVDCSGFGQTLQVLAVDTDGAVWHGLRNGDGTWNGLNLLSSNINGQRVSTVSTAAVGGELHALAIAPNPSDTSRYSLYHRVRHTDGTWTGWASPPGSDLPTTNALKGFINVSGAEVRAGELNVVLSSFDGRVYHSIRHTNGAWDGFGDVTGPAGTPSSDPVIGVTAAGSAFVSY